MASHNSINTHHGSLLIMIWVEYEMEGREMFVLVISFVFCNVLLPFNYILHFLMLVKLSAHNSISELKSSQGRRSRDNVKMYALKYQMIELNPKFNSQILLDNQVEKTVPHFK